ncbi:putative MFS family arabinose efflux permease [Actinomadura pelletieri DSM 43383]|uniref:Putative MFS family arabinose efflux permease n=1 Tax=Actinomadura pelletieri DSM 43383 TaxID=1120940 RepID=A0A495QYE1_9ACTN|nr:MFS transporter [Actinomadura pelletieri]RKS79150.1 putative MFS family arabinose efflux permease [Actinomadura pelletieri DSM 43383]
MTTVLEPEHTAGAVPGRGLLGSGYRGTTFGIVLVVTLLAFESMAVGTVMPVVADDLDGLSLYAWGFSATLIMSLLSTVLAGGWIDRSGPVRPLMIGLGTFVVGLLVAGAAPSMWLFVVGRAVQGLGTGVSLVALYVVIARVYPEALRSRVFAALSAAWVLPSLIGPGVGGVVAEHVDWRWVFLGLVPLVIPPTLLLVPALRGIEKSKGSPSDGRGRAVAAVAVAAGAGALLYGLDRPGWTMPLAAALGIAGLAYGLPRLLPAGTLRLRRGLPSVVLVRGLLAGAFFGADVFIPLALTRLHDFTATQAGIVLTVGALGWSAASQIQGRSERPREFYALLGAVFVTAGVIAVAVALQISGWLAVPAWIIGGAGMGFSIGSLSVLLLDLSPEDEQGVNSSALQISDTLGSSLVVGIAGALVTGFGGERLGTGLAVAGGLFAAIAAFGVIAALRLEVRT